MGNFTTKEAGPSEGPENLMQHATAEAKVALAKSFGKYTTRRRRRQRRERQTKRTRTLR